jgi:GTP-binding protein
MQGKKLLQGPLIMQISGTAQFIRSASSFAQLPPPQGDEYAVVGRSNVGKSSFINHVCAMHKLARTSKRPGTTVCINLFKLGETLYWVDLPGYGYAERAKKEPERWGALIDDYCRKRGNLKGIIWMVDSRHIGVAMDCKAYAWLHDFGKPVLPVLAKADKLSAAEQRSHAIEFMKRFGRFGKPVMYSIHEQAAKERFWERFEAWRTAIR